MYLGRITFLEKMTRGKKILIKFSMRTLFTYSIDLIKKPEILAQKV